jgi:mannosyl-oligosaccharide alpha-1,2-mannosidase
MKPHSLALAALLPAVLALPANTPDNLQYTRRQDATDRAQAVVDVFRTSWAGYYEYAFPNDELKPVSNGFSNSRWVAVLSHVHI